MVDGAHLGLSAKTALKTILGGEEPAKSEEKTPEEMFLQIISCTENPNTYDGTATYCAHLILNWLLLDPERAHTSPETEYDWQGDPDHGSEGMKPEFLISLGWYEQMKKEGIMPEDGLGLSGFQWGWAVNAARRCLALNPVANPALLEI